MAEARREADESAATALALATRPQAVTSPSTSIGSSSSGGAGEGGGATTAAAANGSGGGTADASPSARHDADDAAAAACPVDPAVLAAKLAAKDAEVADFKFKLEKVRGRDIKKQCVCAVQFMV